MNAILYCNPNPTVHTVTYIALSHIRTCKVPQSHGAYLAIRLNINNQSKITLVFLLCCTTEGLICHWSGLLRFTRNLTQYAPCELGTF